MSLAAGSDDPFASIASASTYVPRDACEAVLDAAEWALRAGQRTLVLSGPAGIGKTTLLRVLSRRLREEFRTLYAPYAALPADELFAWLLGLLEEKSEGQPEEELLAAAHTLAKESAGLVVMIDDATSVPLTTARRLARLVAKAEGALRLIVVCVDEGRSGRILSALGPVLEEVRLALPMTAEESAHYIQQRLEFARAPERIASRFDAETVELLHRRAGGLPQLLNVLADERVRLGESIELPATNSELLPDLPVEGDADRARDEAELWYEAEEPEPESSSWHEPLFRRRVLRLEAPPRWLAVFGVTLLVGLGAVLLPWLRGGIAVAPRGEVPRVAPDRPVAQELPRPARPAPPPPPPEAPAGEARERPAALVARPRPAEPPRTEPRAQAPGVPAPRIAQPVPEVRPAPARAPAPRQIAAPSAPAREPTPAAPRTAEPSQASAPARNPEPRTSPEQPATAVVVAPLPAPRREPAAPVATVPEPARPEAPAPRTEAAPAAAATAASAERAPAPAPVAYIAVNINATPWAIIRVDGIELGETPLAGVPLLPGRHILRAELPDGRIVVREVDVGPENRHFALP